MAQQWNCRRFVRGVGAVGLAACVVSGSISWSSAAAPAAVAAPAEYSVSGQLPTPTPTPVANASGQAGDIVPVQGDLIGDLVPPTPVTSVQTNLENPIELSPNVPPSNVQIQLPTPIPQTIAVAGCAPVPE